jgi:hypothetical protein
VSYAASSSSTPSRLVRRRGSWALELTRLVALDGNVLEPRPQRLEGSDAILRHLRQSTGESTLAQSAAHLMRAVRGDDDRAFVVLDGEWVPSSSEAPSRYDAEAGLLARLADVRSELLLLRASHQRLRDRVAELEARLEGLSPDDLPRRSIEPLRTEAIAREVVAPVLAPVATLMDAGALPGPAPDLTRQSPGAAPEPPPPVNPFRNVASVLGADDAPPANGIKLPDAAAVIASIGELFGGDPGLVPSTEPVPESALELAALYAGRFVDDDGKDLGVLLGELKLVAHIGGKLMGLPSTVIEEQAKTGILSEQVMLAMSEVVNTLSSTLNRLPGNAHVRGTPVETFPTDRLQWLGSARHSVALGRNRVGTLWLLAR